MEHLLPYAPSDLEREQRWSEGATMEPVLGDAMRVGACSVLAELAG